jgi:hypothetical protein
MSTGEFVSIAGVLAVWQELLCDIKVVVSIQCSVPLLCSISDNRFNLFYLLPFLRHAQDGTERNENK